jgi:titin
MSSYNFEKALSLDWNGQVFVLTVRNEVTSAYNYLYSYDGSNWTPKLDLSNSAIVNRNPFNVKWTGSKFAMVGNITTSAGNTIATSVDGINFSPISSNLSTPLYDLETNLECPHTITFPRNATLALGGSASDTTKIAYSLDEGVTWTPSANSNTVFTTTANNATWNGRIWVAVGQGGNTIGTSIDGNVWVGRGSYIFTTAGYAIAWSTDQVIWIAGGSGTNSLAYSSDGVFWTGLGTIIFSAVYDVQWNGNIWVATGIPSANGGKSLAYSYNGKNWSVPTQNNLFDLSGTKLTWNGSFWTAIGSSSSSNSYYNIATSSDGIIWSMQYNTTFINTPITNIYTNSKTDITLITAPKFVYTDTASQYVPILNIPNSPTSLSTTGSTSSTISISFTGITGVDSYTVTAVPDSGSTVSQTFAAPNTSYTITGLQNGTTYTVSLAANNAFGSSFPSNTATATTYQAPPTGLSSSSITTTSASISFTPPSGTITSYTLTAVPSSGSNVVATGITSSPYSLTGLTINTSYTISMVTINSVGTSSASSSISVRTLSSPPTSLSASSITATGASISFTAPSGTVTSYTLTAVPSSGSNVVATGITSSPYSLTGLTANTSYTISMVAVNSSGSSAASSTVTILTLASPPTLLSTSNITTSSAVVAFTPSTGTISSYTLTAVPSSGSNVVATGITTSPYSLTGLSSNINYTITMVAINTTGSSAASSSATALTLPSTPTDLSYNSPTATTAVISFTVPSGTGTLSYTATSVPTNGGYPITQTSISSTPFTLTGLTQDTVYNVSLVAANTTGSSSSSDNLTVYTVETPPTDLSASNVTSTTAVISFTPVIGTVTSYTITGVPTSGSNVVTTGVTSSPYTITGLTSNMTYTVTMTTVNQYGSSAASSSIQVVTVPGAPSGLSSSNVTNNSASISFTTLGGTVTSYTLTATTSAGVVITNTGITTSPYALTGLTNNNTYTITMVAINATGTSASSSSISILTLPNPPQFLSVNAVTTTTASINFVPPVGTVSSYTITATPTSGSSIVATGITSSPGTITGLSIASSYTVSMVAITPSGTSASSSSLTVVTLASPPTNVANSNVFATNATISFTTASGLVSSYTITAVPASGSNIVATGVTSSPYLLTGLTAFTSYTVTIQSVNAGGSSASSSSTTFTTVSVMPTTGLVFYYPFNNDYLNYATASDGVVDISGVLNTTFSNNPVKLGAYCLNLNNSGYITLPLSTLNNLAAGTIACWVYLNSSSDKYTITSKQRNGSNTYGLLTIGHNWDNLNVSNPGYIYWHPNNAFGTSLASTTQLVANTWYHIAVSFSSSSASIYINGSLNSTKNGNSSIANDMTSTQTSFIGRWFADGSTYGLFNGYIDDFRIYNIALSSNDVANIYGYVSATPSNLAVTSVSSTSVSISYTASSEPSYKIYAVPVNSSLESIVTRTFSGGTTYTLNGLTPGILYTIGFSTIISGTESNPIYANCTTSSVSISSSPTITSTTLTSNINNALTPNNSRICTAKSDPRYVFAAFISNTYFYIYVSSNGGTSWSLGSSLTFSNSGDGIITLFCSDSGRFVYFGTGGNDGGSYIWRSSNYGASFTRSTSQITWQANIYGDCDSTGQYIALANGNLQSMFLSNNYGANFTSFSPSIAGNSGAATNLFFNRHSKCFYVSFLGSLFFFSPALMFNTNPSYINFSNPTFQGIGTVGTYPYFAVSSRNNTIVSNTSSSTYINTFGNTGIAYRPVSYFTGITTAATEPAANFFIAGATSPYYGYSIDNGYNWSSLSGITPFNKTNIRSMASSMDVSSVYVYVLDASNAIYKITFPLTSVTTTQALLNSRYSIYSDTTSYALSSSSNTISPGTSSFTLEFFFYPSNLNNVQQGVLGLGDLNAAGFTVLYYSAAPTTGYNSSNITLAFMINNISNTYIFIPNIIPYHWSHIAIVRTYGTTLNAYVNGVLQSTTNSTNLISNNFTANSLVVGRMYTSNTTSGYGNGKLGGYLGNIRLTKSAVYSGTSTTSQNFNIPTSPLPLTQSSGTNIAAITSGQVVLLIDPDPTNVLVDRTTNVTFTNYGLTASNNTCP